METNQTIRQQNLNERQQNNPSDIPDTAAAATEYRKIMTDTSGNTVWIAHHTKDTFQDGGGRDTVYSKASYTLADHLENLVLGGSANIYGAGNNADNILIGNSGNNRLNSGRGNDIVLGGAGRDTINGGSGNDVLYGGAGNDTYLFSAANGKDTIIDTEGSNIVKFAADTALAQLKTEVKTYTDGSQDWIITHRDSGAQLLLREQVPGKGGLAVERFIIGNRTFSAAEFAQAQNIAEPVLDNRGRDIRGTAADDTLTGTAGNDTINGQAGADTMQGLAGDDVYYVDHSGDRIIENAGSGIDSVFSSVSHTLATHVENLTLTGSANIFGAGNNSNNILTGNSGNNRLNSGRGDDKVYGMGGHDTLNGGEGNDYLDGGAGSDKINGGAGNDTLVGGAGRDILRGGAGDDIYEYGSDDTIIDNEGRNTLRFSDGLTIDNVKLEIITQSNGSQDWQISSANGSALIKNQQTTDGGTAVDAFILGGQVYSAAEFMKRLAPQAGGNIQDTPEADVLHGTENNDIIYAGKDRDTVYGNGGDDVVYDQGSEYYGSGQGSDDFFYGGTGNDRIYGGIGADHIDGGSGNDHLEGGDHRDTYVFGRGYGRDTVFDYAFARDDEFNPGGESNIVKFIGGIKPEDLEVSLIKGYDQSKVYYNPADEQWKYLNRPIVDGNTWQIRIKGTDDVLTILNQNPSQGAVDLFEFDSGSLTSEALFRTLNLTPDEITAGLSSQIKVRESGVLTMYGTSQNDYFSLDYSDRFYFGTDNIIYGGAGNDSIEMSADSPSEVKFYGGSGDDSFQTHYATKGIFDGGLGNDTLKFGMGTAAMTVVFRAGDGHDHVYAGDDGGFGGIHLTGGLRPQDISISYMSDSAVIKLNGSGDTITLHNGNIGMEEVQPLNQIRFDSGETLALAWQSNVPAANAGAVPDWNLSNNAGIV